LDAICHLWQTYPNCRCILIEKLVDERLVVGSVHSIPTADAYTVQVQNVGIHRCNDIAIAVEDGTPRVSETGAAGAIALAGVIGERGGCPRGYTGSALDINQLDRSPISYQVCLQSRYDTLQPVASHGEGLILLAAFYCQFVQQAYIGKYAIRIQYDGLTEDDHTGVMQEERGIIKLRVSVDLFKLG
jgi:hypothetical protein